MRIALNARVLSADSPRGWSRYTANLIRELSHMGIQIVLVSDRPLNRDFLEGANQDRIVIMEEATRPYVFWEQVTLPRICDELGVDLLHCPHHFGLPIRGKFKKVLTLHDAIEDTFYAPKQKVKNWLGNFLVDRQRVLTRKVADKIITVSEYSKSEIVRVYGVPKAKVAVTYGAADPLFHETADSSSVEKFQLQEPYFLYVGGYDERKNIPFLVEAFKEWTNERGVNLVLAGKGSEEFDEPAAKIHGIGRLADENLPSLYAGARCFVYPSLMEGFGLQIVESIQMATPVLVSDRTSLPEVIANPDVEFDPQSIESLNKLLSQVSDDDNFYDSIKDKAKVRAKDFSWRKTAEKTLNIYKSLLGEL